MKPVIIKPVFDENLFIRGMELHQGDNCIIVSMESTILHDGGYKWEGIVKRVEELRRVIKKGWLEDEPKDEAKDEGEPQKKDEAD